MADERKTQNIKLTNTGAGPRTFFGPNGEAHVLRPGQTFEGDILEADVASLSADLVQGDVEGDPAPAADVQDFGDYPDLANLTRPALLEVARREGYAALAASGPEVSDDDLRDAIQNARDDDAARMQEEAGKLVADNTAEQLRKIAADEGVAVESDDNKSDLARKIVEGRRSGE